MKMFARIAFCLAATGAIAPAFAFSPASQDHGGGWQDNQHGDHDGDHRGDDHGRGNDHRDYGRNDHRDNWHPGNGGHWERNRRYDGRQVVFTDYRSRHLRAPGRGQHWVRADNGDLLLVAIATGIIVDIASQ